MYALRLAFGSALMAASTLVNHCSGLEPVVPTPLVTPNSVNAETLPFGVRQVGDHAEVLDQAVEERGRAGVVVRVEAEDVDELVARVGAQVGVGVPAEPAARAERVQEVGDALDVAQVLDRVAEELLVLAGGAERGTPPEPGARVLVPRPEDDRDEVALGVAGAVGRGGDVVQVRVEVGVLRAAGQDRAQRVARGVVEAAAGDEVLHVRGQGVDAAETVRLRDVVVEGGDVLRGRVARRARGLVALQDQRVPAEDRREVAGHVLDVGLGAVGAGNGQAVRRRVLVAEQDALAADAVEVGEQRPGRRAGVRVDDGDGLGRLGGGQGHEPAERRCGDPRSQGTREMTVLH